MSILNDEGLGLRLKGYDIVPNEALATTIAVYTPEIIQSILNEQPEVVHSWLQKLHSEYTKYKRYCDLENDLGACFDLGLYEEFEKRLKEWEEGLSIKIKLGNNKFLVTSKVPLYSNKRIQHLEKIAV